MPFKLLAALLSIATLFAQQDFDFLLKGGTVIDPKNGINAVRDVGIKDGRVEAVAANLSRSAAVDMAERLAFEAEDSGDEVELVIQGYTGELDHRRSGGG